MQVNLPQEEIIKGVVHALKHDAEFRKIIAERYIAAVPIDTFTGSVGAGVKARIDSAVANVQMDALQRARVMTGDLMRDALRKAIENLVHTEAGDLFRRAARQMSEKILSVALEDSPPPRPPRKRPQKKVLQ